MAVTLPSHVGRLAIPGDVIYFPIAEGVEVRNANDILRLRGAMLYDLLDRLVPHLDGSRTLEEICQNLSQAEQKTVTRLCEVLLSGGYLRQLSGTPTAPSPAGTWTGRSAGEEPEPLRYVGYFAEQPQRRYLEFCRTPITVAGTGYSLLALVHALSRFDLEAVRVVVPTMPDARLERRYSHRIGEYLRSGKVDVGHHHRRNWELVSADDVALEEALADRDALFYAADPGHDRSQVPSLEALIGVCRSQGKVLAAGDFVEGWAVAGPLMGEAAEGCPACARRALALVPGAARGLETSTRSAERSAVRVTPSPALASLLANELAGQWLQLRTAAGESIHRDQVVLFEPQTLSRARFLYERSPQCPCRTSAGCDPETRSLATSPSDRP